MPPPSASRLIAFAALSLTATSCSWVGKDGTRHTLVLGVGVISTKEITKDKATITQSSLLGLTLRASPTTTGIMLGYEHNLVTQIPRYWNGHFGLELTPHHRFRIHSLNSPSVFSKTQK